jgi:hypothetical protein
MVDPITLTSVGTVVIAEGIKFLYGQATELLKRWRDRSESDAAAAVATEPTGLVLPSDVFDGQLVNPVIHYIELEKVRAALSAHRRVLADYGDGIAAIDLNDSHVLSTIDSLRQLLEAVYQQRITFKGESREPSGPIVKGQIDVGRILGNAAGVEAEWIAQGNVEGTVRATEVGPNAKATGVKAGKIG